MKGRSALPRGAFGLALATLGVAAAGVLWGRELLARLPYFDVRQVEVIGALYVAPDSVIELAAIGAGRSVWEDFAALEQRLASHPLIEAVEVRRHGMRTLRLVVHEVEPVAFVDVGELRAVRADGRLLPIDPLAAPLDLPVITVGARLDGDSAKLREGPPRTALRLFVRLRSLDPGLAAVISDFAPARSGGWIANLMTSQPAQRMILPAKVDEALIQRVRATLADLRGRGVLATLIDARFADQIVVRMATVRPGDRGKSGRKS